MSIKNKLQIYLITYNRKKHLGMTLDSILNDNSPIRDFDITVLDNASTDGSSELIDEYCDKFPNLKHIRHNVNIGGNANICRAFEMGANCGKEYFWVLCDDDKYDFSNWSEVEENIINHQDVICVADYVYPNKKEKLNPAYQIFQLTFVPAGIFKSSLINSDVLINMYDSILTMFQQSVVTIKCINENKSIKVLSTPIVFNGLHFEDKVDNDSVSYIRGVQNKWILERRADTNWILGFSNVITLLKDEKLKEKCMEVAIPYKDIYGSFKNFNNCMTKVYLKQNKEHYLIEILNCLKQERKLFYQKYKANKLLDNLGNIQLLANDGYGRIHTKKTTFLQQIFSVKNEGRHKLLRILGIKFKIRRKHG